jgi:hypothetical protein
MIHKVANRMKGDALIEAPVYGKEASMNPTTIALGYLIAGAVFVPLILHFFKTRFDWIDIGLAAVGGAAASLIPTVGGVASYAAMIGILYWRLGKNYSLSGRAVRTSCPRPTTATQRRDSGSPLGLIESVATSLLRIPASLEDRPKHPCLCVRHNVAHPCGNPESTLLALLPVFLLFKTHT